MNSLFGRGFESLRIHTKQSESEKAGAESFSEPSLTLTLFFSQLTLTLTFFSGSHTA